MEIANNVKKRKRTTTLAKVNANSVVVRNSQQSKQISKEKGSSPKKKASPHLKSLSKARKISARRGNNTVGNNRRRVSRLVLSKAKKTTPNRNDRETPSKPTVYRTRNAASMAYEEKLMAVRAASQDPKKSNRALAKKDATLSANEEDSTGASKFEPVNESRVLACGLWFKVGDIISVYGDEKAGHKIYYAKIVLFLRDRYGEQYCNVRWLVPVSRNKQSSMPFSFSCFDFDNYLEGPLHTEPIKMSNVNFVAHTPSGAGSVKPGMIDHLQPNPYSFLYRQKNDVKILDCPSRTATTIDPKLRNPYL